MRSSRPFSIPEISVDEHWTTQECVYLRLRNAILIGSIVPGSALTIRGLAEYLSLSPTPVREAVRRLSSEHAIEILGNRRITIPEMTAGRFEELTRLRIAVEIHAGKRALPYVSDILIEKMTEADDLMDIAVREENFDSLTILNQKFHRLLYSANPNQTVMPIVESVWLQLGPFQRQVLNAIKSHYVVDRHKEIISALQARDARTLAVAIEADVRDGSERPGWETLTKMTGQ